MGAYKVVGRFKDKESQARWCRGKPGTQAKKATYISEEDFNKYSPELIKRWDKNGYLVERYKMTEKGWMIL